MCLRERERGEREREREERERERERERGSEDEEKEDESLYLAPTDWSGSGEDQFQDAAEDDECVEVVPAVLEEVLAHRQDLQYAL